MPHHTSPALCVFVKDEVADLTEWLSHHAAIGFSRFLVYDNQSSDGTTELLGELSRLYPIIQLRWPGNTSETPIAAYRDCIARFGPDHAWIAFFDVDEFLIPPQGGTVQDLLVRYSHRQSFVINRLTFGSSGLRRLDDRLVMASLTRRGPVDASVNAVVRSFVRPATVHTVTNTHLIVTQAPAVILSGVDAVWDAAEEPGTLVRSQVMRADFALHHYATRSDEHWLRGMNRIGQRGGFYEGNLNTYIDTSALPYADRVSTLMNGRLAVVMARHVIPRRRRPQSVDPANLLCNIDELSPRRIRGWMLNEADPLAPPRLRFLVDDTEIYAMEPNLPREDVAAAGIGGLRVGFCFRIPYEWFDGHAHRLRACIDDGREVPISQSGKDVGICEFQERHEARTFEGSFDGIVGAHACGWVLRVGNPTSLLLGGVEIVMTCGDRQIGRFTANEPRADVGAAYGDLVNPLCCGFKVCIPPEFRRRAEQTFRIFTAREGVELDGSPVNAMFEEWFDPE